MKMKPFSMVAGLAENTFVFLFNYAGDENNFETDKTAYKAELEDHLLVGGSFLENGIALTDSDLTTTVNGSDLDIIPSSGTVDMSGTDIAHPLVIYKGTAVPYSDFVSFTPATAVIKITPATTYPDSEADYVVYYFDPLLGIVTACDAPNVSLPLEQTSFSAVGHDDPVIQVSKRGDPEASGSLTCIEHQTPFLWTALGGTPANAPGEELLSRVYGSDWTKGAGYSGTWNRLKAPTQPFGICILSLSGEKLISGTAGEVWGTLTFIYHCRLTSISPPANITNDSTDPIIRTIEFTCQFPDSNEQVVQYTSAS